MIGLVDNQAFLMGIEGKIVVCRPPPLHEMTFRGHTLLFKATISKTLNIPSPFPMRSGLSFCALHGFAHNHMIHILMVFLCSKQFDMLCIRSWDLNPQLNGSWN